MARRLRFVGTNSGNNGCPAIYEDLDSGEIVVQGDLLTDVGDIDQLRNLDEREATVAVPRELLVDFAPREVVRVPKMISFAEFDEMFETFEHVAWRLETRRRYQSDEVTETYRRFIAGQHAGYDLEDPWCISRREQAALGKRFERVRIVDEQPTPGQLYLLDNARRNAEVGEDIRNLCRADADALGLPAEDFWVFDSRVVAALHFDEGDRMTGVELITEPLAVLRTCQVRDAAWHHAVPFREFEAQVRSAG